MQGLQFMLHEQKSLVYHMEIETGANAKQIKGEHILLGQQIVVEAERSSQELVAVICRFS